MKLNKTILVISLTGALGLTGCQLRHSSGGPPPEGGSLGIKSSLGAGGTNAPSLTGNNNANPNTYNGAGFQSQTFESTTIPDSKHGLPIGPTTIQVEQTPYGPVLAAPNGKTLYMRLGDSPTHSGCVAACLLAFPPELTNGAPQAGGGILAAYLGVLTAPIKGEQIAYSGHPLYTYSGDTRPGQIGAQGAGGIWFAVTPVGGPLRTPATSSSTTIAG